MRALDLVIDRCEDTVRGTSHNLLCWLLSSRLQSRREFAFNFVVERNSEIRYRRTQKQFLAFVLRMYRMPGDARREMVNVKIKPEISTQLDRIWEHSIWNRLDVSKGNWTVMERQGSPLVGTHSGSMGGQSTDVPLNTRACQGSDGREGAEDGEIDDENVEAWELEDEDDDEDDYDDSGYYDDDADGYTAGTHQDLFSGRHPWIFRGSSEIPTRSTVSHATVQVTMNDFRKLPDYFITQAEALCDRLMFGIQPNIGLSRVKEDITSSKSGHSFIKYPENGLESAYLELLVHAYTTGRTGLAQDGVWKWHAVTAYLKLVSRMEEQLAGGLYTACGQTPRISKLLSLEYENGPNTSCGIYAWGDYMVYVIRHHKAKRLTNREFYVVRFLPVRLGHVLFRYLAYVRRVADLLRREQLGADISAQRCLQTRLLFQNNGRPWPTSRLTDVVTKTTLEFWQQRINVRTYCQLAIAITEKHVRKVYTPFNRHDDWSNDADINAIFAWQSGHRLFQRGIMYGLTGAYPFRLQPPLLQCYEWASLRWHEFLRQSSKTYVLYLTRYPSPPSYSQPTGSEPLQRSSQTPYLQ
ncbi:hypothetical protein FOMG_17728 [Fusarium oxysporum f. sp. melonis 26406]|uniref:Uncharacterized protein n=1 Tax=Fusarium oxysporum f. sp. melonis 26406 TaxID=1089452 RepID=W9Z1G2_FUSOX|nr:hypothetical protein FOMG_17728 [Fusarium oxysporum f. sp. melonis 26406]